MIRPGMQLEVPERFLARSGHLVKPVVGPQEKQVQKGPSEVKEKEEAPPDDEDGVVMTYRCGDCEGNLGQPGGPKGSCQGAHHEEGQEGQKEG